MKLSYIFSQFPALREWALAKKLNSTDLSLLTEFKSLSALKPLLKWIGDRRPSHAEGKQILDLGGEALLMGKDLREALKGKTAPELIKSLKKLRQPETRARDEEKSKIVNSLPWTSSIKAKWIRQNDKGGLSIHFKSFSLRDLRQKAQKLNSVCRELGEGPKKLWRN